MKSGPAALLGLAATLASWRAAFVLLHTWVRCKPREGIFNLPAALILRAELTLLYIHTATREAREPAAPSSTQDTKRNGKKGASGDEDAPGAKDAPAHPDLGPCGPSLKQQKLSRFRKQGGIPTSWLQPDYSDDGAWLEEESCPVEGFDDLGDDDYYFGEPAEDGDLEAMDPEWSPSPIRKVADTARSSSSADPPSSHSKWGTLLRFKKGS